MSENPSNNSTPNAFERMISHLDKSGHIDSFTEISKGNISPEQLKTERNARDLLRYKNTYKIVADVNTEVYIERLLKLSQTRPRDQRLYEMVLYNLLNDVIKTAFQQGRNSLA